MERTKKDVGRICWGCEKEIYIDEVGDIECGCGIRSVTDETC